MSWYVPAVQITQRAMRSSPAKDPFAQAAAVAEPNGQYLPVGQGKHAVALERLVALENEPSGQGSGAMAPASQ